MHVQFDIYKHMSFVVTDVTDKHGRHEIEYAPKGDQGGILRPVETGSWSNVDVAVVGFPIITAFVGTAATDDSPDSIEDVTDALKGKSPYYFMTNASRQKFVLDGTRRLTMALENILHSWRPKSANKMSYTSDLEAAAKRHHGWKYAPETQIPAVADERKSLRTRAARAVPIVIQEVPSSHGHTKEIADAIASTLESSGLRILRSAAQLEKVKVTSTGEVPSGLEFKAHPTLLKAQEFLQKEKLLKPNGQIDDVALKRWEEEGQTKKLPAWIRNMANSGRKEFSIGDVPSIHRKNVRGYIQSRGGESHQIPVKNDTSEPYVLVIVDDNFETGFSMRATAEAVTRTAKHQPAKVIGCALINLMQTGAPRRKLSRDQAAERSTASQKIKSAA